MMILHGYFRSSAAWRVRLALNLKGLVAEQASTISAAASTGRPPTSS